MNVLVMYVIIYMAAEELSLLWNPHIPRLYKYNGSVMAEMENGGRLSKDNVRSNMLRIRGAHEYATKARDYQRIPKLTKELNSWSVLYSRMNDPNEIRLMEETGYGGQANLDNVSNAESRGDSSRGGQIPNLPVNLPGTPESMSVRSMETDRDIRSDPNLSPERIANRPTTPTPEKLEAERNRILSGDQPGPSGVKSGAQRRLTFETLPGPSGTKPL